MLAIDLPAYDLASMIFHGDGCVAWVENMGKHDLFHRLLSRISGTVKLK